MNIRGGSNIPKGLISMWYGLIADIPSGWALCDGSLGTPDLRNKFIVCADADSGGFAKTTITGSPSQTGGAASHQHSVGSLTNATQYDYLNTGSGVASGANLSTGTAGHLHTISGQTANTVSLPTYWALAYIMKL